MIDFNLVSKNHCHVITSTGIRSGLEKGFPILVDPSITFHKHFEMPLEVNRNRNKVMVELFSQYLPTAMSKYRYKFMTQKNKDGSTINVLGLAIKNEEFNQIKNQVNYSPDVFFLESILRNRYDNTRSLLELSLPEGIFFGVFEENYLSFIRYQQNPTSESLEETRTFLNERLPDTSKTEAISPFSSEGEGDRPWVNDLKNWMIDSLPRENRIKQPATSDRWARWRKSAWTLLILMMISITIWGSYEFYLIDHYNKWMQKGAEALIGESENPYQKVSKRVKTLQKKIKRKRQTNSKVYSRLEILDKHVAQNDLHLLQLQTQKNQTQLTFLTSSLQNADQLKSSLQQVSSIKRSEIISTQSNEQNNFKYSATLNIMWKDKGEN